MATIIFSIGAFSSHLNASFQIARQLKERGHRIIYVSDKDLELDVGSQGFEFEQIFTEFSDSLDSPEYLNNNKFLSYLKNYFQNKKNARKMQEGFLKGDMMEQMVKKIKADLIIIDAHLIFYVPVLHKYRIPTVILETKFPIEKEPLIPPINSTIIPRDTWWCSLAIGLAWWKCYLKKFFSRKDTEKLRNGRKFLKKMAQKYNFPFREEFNARRSWLNTFESPAKVILCSKAFDFPHKKGIKENHYYAGTAVNINRREPSFRWDEMDPSKPLIYCAMGTLSHIYIDDKFLKKIIAVFKEKKNYQLIISSGNTDPFVFQNILPNVFIVQYAPQIEILKKAAMMITHGGLNSIKECITLGVPMLVYPFANDGFGNSARVVYHRLGLRGNIRRDSVKQISHKIESILTNPSYRQNINKMYEKILGSEEPKQVIDILESFLIKKGGKNPSKIKVNWESSDYFF